MTVACDLTGRRFGLLVAKSIARLENGKRAWLCDCDCGAETLATAGHLNGGRRLSCGCRVGNSTHRLTKTPLYRVWAGMHWRCKDTNQPRYGGRGITVCERWEKFENFLEDMGATYARGLEIDRKDNDGPYSPENCRWVTKTVNARNRSDNRRVVLRGVEMTCAEAAEITGLNKWTLLERAQKGLTEATGLFTPVTSPRIVRRLSAFGKTMTLRRWAQETGINYDTLKQRMRYGWPLEQALTMKPGVRTRWSSGNQSLGFGA